MYNPYTPKLMFGIVIIILITIFIILNRKNKSKVHFHPRTCLYIILLLIFCYYIISSLEKYILLVKYKQFSEHLVEFVTEYQSNKLKYPISICDLTETNSYQIKKKYILWPFNPRFKFIGKVRADTFKYVFYTSLFNKKDANKVRINYWKAFIPFYNKDIIISKSWVKNKSPEEFIEELDKQKNRP